jgi:hypothetical protein
MQTLMQAEALPDPSSPGGELRYVTEHFLSLQGLRVAPLWAAFLLDAIVSPLFQPTRRHAAEMLIFVIAIAALWLPWSHAWYRRHYGTIVKSAPQPVPGLAFTIVVFMIVFAGSALFHSLDRYRGALNLWIVLMFTLPPCCYLGAPSLLIRLRRALYITASVAIFFTVGSVPFLHPSKWLVISGICTTLLLLSLYDHWLLHHLLHGGIAEPSDD